MRTRIRRLAGPPLHPGRAASRPPALKPAVAAIRCNPDMKQTYRTLAERGKPGKVAVVAIMRKLLVLANVLIKQDRLWTPQRPQAHTKQAIGHSPLPMLNTSIEGGTPHATPRGSGYAD